MASTSASGPLTTYGATTTRFLTTTISLSADQASFTILFPPPGTAEVQETTFPVTWDPSRTYTPSPLPTLIITNIVGIAINPSGQPIATRTLAQPALSQSTSTSASSPAQPCTANTWACYSLNRRVGICLGSVLGFLLVFVLLFWLLFWRPHIKKIRVRLGLATRPGDEENGRPPLRIGVRTSMAQMASKGEDGRDESLTPPPPPPPPPSGRGEDAAGDGVRVVSGGKREGEPASYRVVRQPSVRDYVRPVVMPEGPSARDLDGAGEARGRDFAAPAADAATGGGVARASGMGRRSEGGVKVARGESMREGRGWRRERRDVEDGYEMRERVERRRDKDRDETLGYGRRRSQSHRERDEDDALRRRNQSHREREEDGGHRRRSQSNRERDQDGGHRRIERRRDQEDGNVDRRRRKSFSPRDDEDFEARGGRSPGRRQSGRDADKRRPRR